MAQQARQHAEGCQQVGAPHNIGDRFGEQRVQSPNRGQRQSRRRFSKNQHAQRIHQRNVNFVQHEINPVIANRARAVAENCVIQQVGESGEWPIQAGGGADVPIPSSQDGLDVFERCLPNAGIPPNHRSIVEHQGPLEGIGIGDQDEAPNCQQPPPVPAPRPARSLCQGAWCRGRGRRLARLSVLCHLPRANGSV